MPPPKKAAKKTAKKAAKKTAGKHHGHHAAKDARRAYEHLGRLEALQGGLPARVVTQVSQLSEIAQQAMKASDSQSAADLLRAAEHLSFAALAPKGAERVVNSDLLIALTEEFDHLRHKAQVHWHDAEDEHHSQVAALYDETLQGAEDAMGAGNYRRGMELIRAAEALAHVAFAGDLQLPSGKAAKRLKP